MPRVSRALDLQDNVGTGVRSAYTGKCGLRIIRKVTKAQKYTLRASYLQICQEEENHYEQNTAMSTIVPPEDRYKDSWAVGNVQRLGSKEFVSIKPARRSPCDFPRGWRVHLQRRQATLDSE